MEKGRAVADAALVILLGLLLTQPIRPPFLLVRVIRRVVRVRNLRLGVSDERGLSQAHETIGEL
jgi:hypothetical protein